MSRMTQVDTPVAGATAASYPVSDHCDGRVFFNTDPQARELKSFADVLKWRMTSRATPWPKSLPTAPTPDVRVAVEPGAARITAINHATLLVQLAGVTVLTDPVFSARCSPVQFAGPKRVRAPGIALTALPHVDVVVVSHNHYDHLDVASLRALRAQHDPAFVAPLGNAELLRSLGITRVTELDWWESTRPVNALQVTVTEAQHWSARGVRDRNHALWGGFVMASGGVQVYFAGDTGYGSHFQRIATRCGAIDVALLPIGAYEPRWFMRSQHMNPDDAVRAHLDLQARQSIGIHFGTWQLTDEGVDEPVHMLAAARREHGIADAAFVAPINGEVVDYRASATL